jgi:hypothetical protein
MPLFKKKLPETPGPETERQAVNIGKIGQLPPLEPPREPTIQEQIAGTTEIDYKIEILTRLSLLDAKINQIIKILNENIGK